MGRLLLLLLIIATIVLLWRAFGPHTWRRSKAQEEPPRIKGPDDDEEFLWRLELEQFKKRRAEEQRAQERKKKPDNNEDTGTNGHDKEA